MVAQDGTVAGVDEQDLARAQAPALDHSRRFERDHARFAGGHHQPVRGHLVAERTQAVAVEGGAGEDAVAEGQRGRSVPGLEAGGLVAVEVADRGRHVTPAFPGVGHQRHQGFGDVEAAADQQLEHVVERRGVRAVSPDHGPQLGRQLGLAGAHPGPVALDGVDLAVVGEHPEGLRVAPVGHGVGGVALVEDGQLRAGAGVGEVLIEGGQVGARHQALVDEGAAGTGRDVEADARGGRDALGLPSGPVEAVLPLAVRGVGTGDHRVPDRGHVAASLLAQLLGSDRDRAPVCHAHPVRGQRLREDLPSPLVPLEEDGDRGVGSEKAARDLDHESGAVAALAVGVQAAPMGQAGERGHAHSDHVVGGFGAGGGHEAHAAGRPLGAGRPLICLAGMRQRMRWRHGRKATGRPG